MIDNQQTALNSFEELRVYLKKRTENPIYQENDIREMFINQLDKVLLYHNLNSHYFIKILQNKNEFDTILQTGSAVDYYSVLQVYQVQEKMH